MFDSKQWHKDYYQKNKAKRREYENKNYAKRKLVRAAWVAKNPDRISYHNKKDRLAVLLALGNKCVICGFSDERALHIDHINGGGGLERRTIKAPNKYYKQMLEKLNEYQILCANHNYIKRAENKEFGKCADIS